MNVWKRLNDRVDASIVEAKKKIEEAKGKTEKGKAGIALDKLEAQRDKIVSKLAERDGKIAEARRRAQDDRDDVEKVGQELSSLYTDENELLKHARIVEIDEIADNDFNLNIPRYIDTFQAPEEIDIAALQREIDSLENELVTVRAQLAAHLRELELTP